MEALEAVRSQRHEPPEPNLDRVGSPTRALESTVIMLAAVLLTVGGLVLVLAMIGAAWAWLVLPASAVVAVATVWCVSRSRPVVGEVVSPAGRTAEQVGVAAAVALAVGSMVWSATGPSNHVLIDRDPGSYVTTAKWIANEGSLRVEDPDAAFEGATGLVFTGPAVNSTDDGSLEFQFMHLPAAVAALGDMAGGSWLMFRLSAGIGALGLLSLYVVAVRCTHRPILALLVPAAIGLSMPFVSVVRDLYSEPIALVFAWAGLLAVMRCHEKERRIDAFLGGALIAGTTLARIDGYLLIGVLALLVAAAVVVPTPRRPRPSHSVVLACAAGVAASTALSLVDLEVFSTWYRTFSWPQLRPMWFAVAFVIALAGVIVVLWPFGGVGGWVRLRRQRLADAATAVIVVGLLAGWLIRPLLQTSRYDPSGLAANSSDLQRAEGQPVDALRDYAEQSLRWMAWYLGPITLVLAIVGIALVVHSMGWFRITGPVFAVTCVTLAMGTLYWWQPSISPDHIWVMRRYVPVILPGLALLALLPLASMVDRYRVGTLRGGLVAATATAALVVAPGIAIAPVPMMAVQSGFDHVISQACRMMPSDAAVVMLGEFDTSRVAQPIRSWCGVPVAGYPGPVTRELVANWQFSIARHGKRLVLMTSAPDAASAVTPILGPIVRRTDTAHATRQLESTVSHRPDKYATQTSLRGIPSFQLTMWTA